MTNELQLKQPTPLKLDKEKFPGKLGEKKWQ